MMKNTILALLFVQVTSCSQMTNKNVENVPKTLVIIAYIEGFHGLIDINKISAGKITHINYTFCDVERRKAILPDLKTDSLNLRELNLLK